VPGAVAVSARRDGGHVAIVSRVNPDGSVRVWNPSSRGAAGERWNIGIALSAFGCPGDQPPGLGDRRIIGAGADRGLRPGPGGRAKVADGISLF
jgi:surface antigen